MIDDKLPVVGEPAEGQKQAWTKVIEIQRRLLDDTRPTTYFDTDELYRIEL